MYQCLLVLACLALVQARPNGAPMDACSDFIPRHGASVEQDGATPYLTLVALNFSEELGYHYEPDTVYRGKTMQLSIAAYLHQSGVESPQKNLTGPEVVVYKL